MAILVENWLEKALTSNECSVIFIAQIIELFDSTACFQRGGRHDDG